MLTADMYNKAVVIALSLMELPVIDDQIARINEGTWRDAVSPISRRSWQLKPLKTHWDGTDAASGWLTVIDPCLFRVTADFSEGIEG